MAARDTDADVNTNGANQPGKTASRQRGGQYKRFALALLAVVVTAAIVHGVLLLFHGANATEPADLAHEVSLGQFFYVSRNVDLAGIAGTRFQLHIRLLDEVRATARTRLAERKFKVQQDVEQLLRQAHPDDFADPVLAGLKRQLQEQINESLGLRAISEVIITSLEYGSQPPATTPVAAPSHEGIRAALPSVVEPAPAPS